MISFISSPCTFTRNGLKSGNLSPERMPAPSLSVLPNTSNRWRMSTNDRSAEFFFPDSSNSEEDSNPSLPIDKDTIADWDDWELTGKKMTIPALPFPPTDVFLPGESKQLHLFEARYLALFETVVMQYNKRCAHILIDSGRLAMAAFGTIIHVKNWRRLDVGVVVDFEGIGRLKSTQLKTSVPFLSADFESVEDYAIQGNETIEEAKHLETRFWKAFKDVASMSLKLDQDPIRKKPNTASTTIEAVGGPNLKVESEMSLSSKLVSMNNISRDAKLQAYEQILKETASRAVNYRALNFSDQSGNDMLRYRIEGLSFAGFDFFPSHPAIRQKALEGRDTLERFKIVIEGLEDFSKTLSVKVALEDVLEK